MLPLARGYSRRRYCVRMILHTLLFKEKILKVKTNVQNFLKIGLKILMLRKNARQISVTKDTSGAVLFAQQRRLFLRVITFCSSEHTQSLLPLGHSYASHYYLSVITFCSSEQTQTLRPLGHTCSTSHYLL